jgi:hypothetical protein
MIELFVEKYSVDVDKSFSVMLTLAIDDIKDFSAKNTTFSKTIILPGTNRNNALFGNIFDINAGNNYTSTNPNTGVNFNASVSANAIMFADNIQVFKGTFRILEIIIDNGMIEYEAVVFGELGGFVSKLGTAKLEDLDFSTYNHTYTLANITSSWSNYAGGSGYYYPLIDYGNYSANKKDYNVGTFRPALFIKEYISKIFAATGYTYTSELFTGSGVDALRFRRLIIPHNRKTLQKKSALQLDVNITPIYNLALNGDGSNDTNINLNTQTLIGGFTPSLSNTKFTYSGATQTGTINLDLDVDFNTGISYQAGGISVKKNGTGILGAGIYSGVYPSGGNYTNLLSISGITIASDDYLEVFFSNSGDVGDYADVTINKSRLTFGNTGNNYVDVSINDPLVINDTIPQNILQKDFISSIVKLFNLYIFEDTTKEKNLQIMPFVDFYADATSLDWSNKIDRSQPLRIKPMSELNSRYYEFKYKEDGDYYNDLYKKRYNQTYGSYKYDSGFEFSKDSTTIELIFSGTPLLGYTSEDKVVSTIFKRNGTTTGQGEEQQDSNIRILQAKLISGVASWDIKNAAGTSTLGSYTNYPYAGHFDDPDAPTNDIQFGVPSELFYELVSGSINVNQFNVYWSSYMAEITDKDSKLLTCKVKLSNTDIFNLDFKKLIWIDGSLFRLNKIIDFNASSEDTCTIEALKIINKIY